MLKLALSVVLIHSRCLFRYRSLFIRGMAVKDVDLGQLQELVAAGEGLADGLVREAASAIARDEHFGVYRREIAGTCFAEELLGQAGRRRRVAGSRIQSAHATMAKGFEEFFDLCF